MIDRLLACAKVSAAIELAAHLVPPERRDEFVAASAQVMGCILGVEADKVSTICATVTAEHDAKDAARRAGQS